MAARTFSPLITVQVTEDIELVCFRVMHKSGPYFAVREVDAKVLRAKSGKKGKAGLVPTEQAIRASIRAAVLSLNLKSEQANRAEIQMLKTHGILGKRAPSCSLLNGEDMVSLLQSFQKHKFADSLREAVQHFRENNPMTNGQAQALAEEAEAELAAEGLIVEGGEEDREDDGLGHAHAHDGFSDDEKNEDDALDLAVAAFEDADSALASVLEFSAASAASSSSNSASAASLYSSVAAAAATAPASSAPSKEKKADLPAEADVEMTPLESPSSSASASSSSSSSSSSAAAASAVPSEAAAPNAKSSSGRPSRRRRRPAELDFFDTSTVAFSRAGKRRRGDDSPPPKPIAKPASKPAATSASKPSGKSAAKPAASSKPARAPTPPPPPPPPPPPAPVVKTETRGRRSVAAGTASGGGERLDNLLAVLDGHESASLSSKGSSSSSNNSAQFSHAPPPPPPPPPIENGFHSPPMQFVQPVYPSSLASPPAPASQQPPLQMLPISMQFSPSSASGGAFGFVLPSNSPPPGSFAPPPSFDSSSASSGSSSGSSSGNGGADHPDTVDAYPDAVDGPMLPPLPFGSPPLQVQLQPVPIQMQFAAAFPSPAQPPGAAPAFVKHEQQLQLSMPSPGFSIAAGPPPSPASFAGFASPLPSSPLFSPQQLPAPPPQPPPPQSPSPVMQQQSSEHLQQQSQLHAALKLDLESDIVDGDADASVASASTLSSLLASSVSSSLPYSSASPVESASQPARTKPTDSLSLSTSSARAGSVPMEVDSM